MHIFLNVFVTVCYSDKYGVVSKEAIKLCSIED